MGTSSHPLLTSILAMLQGHFKQSPFSKTTQIRYLKAFYTEFKDPLKTYCLKYDIF